MTTTTPTILSTVTPTITGTSITTSNAATPPTQDYNSDLFLKLLVTQLQNQDPSSPMDSGQMVQQTSELASMQQLTAMSTDTSNSYALQQQIAASNVIGKTVSWTDSTGAAQSGIATSVAFSSSGPTVTVGSNTFAYSAITGVTATASS